MSQLLFPLTQAVTTERGHSLVCIPDRTTAECELTTIRREYGARLIKAVIRKDRRSPAPRHSSLAPPTTYTLRYFTRDTDTVLVF
jgi:hypothetical protein